MLRSLLPGPPKQEPIELVMISYPGIIKNVDKALETLGGLNSITQVLCVNWIEIDSITVGIFQQSTVGVTSHSDESIHELSRCGEKNGRKGMLLYSDDYDSNVNDLVNIGYSPYGDSCEEEEEGSKCR